MKIKQVFVIWGVLIHTFAQGICFGFVSSLLPALRDPNSTIKINLNTASWIVSSVGISSIAGYFLSSFLMEYYGRRAAYSVTALPGSVGWVAVYFAQDFVTILIGRILTGITVGCSLCLGSVVIGEYSSPKFRGVFLNLRTVFFSLGGLFAHLVGNYVSWRTLALLGAIPEIFTLFLTKLWPESPSWLAKKRRFNDCRKAIFDLRGRNDSSIKEFDELVQARNENATKEVSTKCCNGFFYNFTKKEFLKPLVIIALAIFLLEVSGRHYFPAYAFDIIGEIVGIKSHSFYYTIGIDILIIASTSVSTLLSKFLNTRTMLFSTGFSALAVILSFSTFLFIVSVETAKSLFWIPLTLLILFFILTNLACIPVPLALLGEILPLAYKGIGSSISGTFIALTMYVFLQATPFLLVSVKVEGLFLVFGVFLGVALLALYSLLPETKNKTLQEIENYIAHGQYENIKVGKSFDNNDVDDAKSIMLENNAVRN